MAEGGRIDNQTAGIPDDMDDFDDGNASYHEPAQTHGPSTRDERTRDLRAPESSIVDASPGFTAARGANHAPARSEDSNADNGAHHQSGPMQPNTAQANASQTNTAQPAYSLIEVAKHLQVSPDVLRSWNVRFAQVLNLDPAAENPRYSSADVGVLLTIQKLIDQRLSDEQVIRQLMPRRIEPERSPAALAALAVQRAGEEGGISNAAQALTDVLSVIAGSQQSVLNSQSSMREMVTVVVQDNFNLKDENRKLRDRMLELERALAEYQRREETRKERMEARMRALEGTVAALQQQMAQFVQLQRSQARKRGFW